MFFFAAGCALDIRGKIENRRKSTQFLATGEARRGENAVRPWGALGRCKWMPGLIS